MAEIVETDNKIVNSEEFLAEFERVFGKNAEYFMAAAAMRTTPEAKIVDFETLNKLIKKIPTTMSGLLQVEYVLKAVAEASGIENPRTFVEELGG